MQPKKPIEPPVHWPIIAKCKGCSHTQGVTCDAYQFPEPKWSAGNCPLASHVKKEEEKKEKAIDPIKLSKRRIKQ